MGEPGVALDGRGRRALALMGLALVALAASVGFYLHASARTTLPAAQPSVTDLDWLSPEVGWVVLTDSRARSVLFHTVDGGRHWDRQFATVGSAISMRFLDPTHGLMTEATPFPASNPTVLRSDDAGAHWSPITLPFEIGSRPILPFFLDLDHGWLMVRTGRSDTVEDAEIYRTADSGITWTEIASVDPIAWVSHGIQEAGLKRWISFRTTRDGWLGSLEPDGSAAVYVTHDGGDEWRRVALPEPPGGWVAGDTLTLEPPQVAGTGRGEIELVDLSRVDALRGGRTPRAAVLPAGAALPAVVVYSTQDGGETWADPEPTPPGADPALADPAFVDGTAGWLAAGAAVWMTADSGRTWRRTGELPSGRSFVSLAPVDGSVAVAQVASGSTWGLLLTEDSGRSWHAVPSPTLS